MKLLFAFLTLLLVQANPPYLVVDRNLKKPLTSASAFTTEQYLQQTFPIYQAEVDEIIEAVDVAVKAVEKSSDTETQETIQAAHTNILIRKNVGGTATIEVVLITSIDAIHSSFSFALVRQETDVRKAQRRLLDFARYLNP